MYQLIFYSGDALFALNVKVHTKIAYVDYVVVCHEKQILEPGKLVSAHLYR